ncbi:MAG: proprotein convertase P-domain-containing protein [Planctomycetaceae bacterium]
MSLSALLKSFSQIAQKTCRRQRVYFSAVRLETFESRQLLSSISAFPAIPPVVVPGGGTAVIGQLNPLTSIPSLNSNPGAPVTVYLDFDGHTESQDWPSARSDGQTGPVVTPVFDVDNDPTTFSDEELRMIEEVWYRVSEDYSPFNINVTTVNPGTFNDFESVLVSIGGDGAWIGSPGGIAFVNAFNNPVSNTCYVFTDNTGFGGVDHMKGTALAASHEVGHQLGLLHHAVYDSSGNQTAGYDPGRPNLGPIMGAPYTSERETWANAPDSIAVTSIQDDLAVITGSTNRVVRYRTDDHANTIAAASSITVSSANVSASGIIERNNDTDFFQFTTDAGPISFSVEGLNLRNIYSDNSLNFGTNLDAVIRLYDSSGALLDSSNLTTTLFGSVSATVPAGVYYIEVTTTGQYGSIGQYKLAGTVTPIETFSLTVDQSSVFENAGANAATGTVTRSAFANLATPIVVTLTSSDVSELTVPTTVTIPAGRVSATFPIRAIDDQLADGLQRVDITGSATLTGKLRTSTATIDVKDYETLSLSISPTTVLENAGKGAVKVTITRSNTDTLPPNTFAVSNNQLREYNYLGALVRTRTIPWPTGVRPAGENAHDVVVMEDNRVAVYNGNSQAWLSVLTQSSNTWQHISVPQLSTETSVVGTGGISSSGSYVFLTDTKESATEDNGIVRVDVNTGVSTRFATLSPGYRMFMKDTNGLTDIIQEIDYLTGAVINTIPMPVAGSFGFDTGLAFDGTALWVLAGPLGSNQLYKVNPDTGAVLEIHNPGSGTFWDGLAVLNGLIYTSDRATNTIRVYNPLLRSQVNSFNIGTINGVTYRVSGGLAAITGPDRLYATSQSGSAMYEINPRSGVITNTWVHGLNSAEGVATANNEIYVGEFIGRNLRVFDRSGIFQRSVTLSASGIHALGGDNVLSQVDTNLRFRDVYSGLDGRIYAVDVNGSTVGRYDGSTLANDGFITLSNPVNALAAQADGTLWGASASGVLYHFSATGTVISQIKVGSESLVDIDLNITGQILLTSALGTQYQTDTTGTTPTSFSTGSAVVFASFGRHQTFPSGAVLVQLTNSDSTAIKLPSSVIIPIGQRSVTVLADVVDDNVLDGTQRSTITATALTYIGTASGTVTVLDAESSGVDIVASSISEAAGGGATQARVYRTDTDGPFTYVGPRQVLSNNTSQTILDYDKTNSYITVPKQTSRITDIDVTISLTHSFLSDLDIYLVSPKGTRVELVTDMVSNEPDMRSTVFDDAARSGILTGSTPYTGRFRPEGSLLNLNGENPAGRWTLEITDDNRTDFGTLLGWSIDFQTVGLAPMTVNLTKTDDTDEIQIPQTVIIPANQSEIFIPVGAVDDSILDGTRVSGIRASTTTAGYLSVSDKVNVLDKETLLFSVNKSIVPETAGASAITGTLQRLNTDINSSFTVSLTSSDTSELTVPATVTIPAGKSSVTFPISAVDDALFDGTQYVAIRAVTPQYFVDKSRLISVTDFEPKLVLSSSVTSVKENSGSYSVTVTRQQQIDISQPVTVNLSVSAFTGIASPISVPPKVIIPAGQTNQTFTVSVLDDVLLDGTQTATITATASGITEDSLSFQITDHETLSLEIKGGQTSVREDDGNKAAVGILRRSNQDYAYPLTVTLTSSDLSEIRVPTTVTIPSGTVQVEFNIDAINDPVLDGTQSVTITATAANYVTATTSIRVDDHEPPVVTSPAAVTEDSTPDIEWNIVPGAIRYDVKLLNLSTGTEQLYPGITRNRFVIPAEQLNLQPKPEPLGIGRYQVLVRAINQLEQPGYWSVARNFRVTTAPAFTSPTTTSTLVGATFPEISWTSVIDAAGYELVVHNLTTGEQYVILRKNLTTTSYRATENLGSGSYRALVRAYNGSKDYGNFSSTLDFTILASPKVLTPVSGGTFDRSPNLSWSAVAGAATYDVIVRNAVTKAIAFRDRSVPGTSIRVPQDLPDAGYEVLVRAQSGKYFGNWSESRFFDVGASPKITSPLANQQAGAQPKFNWTGISGADRYEVWVLNKDTNAYVIQASNVTAISFTPTTKLPLGEYQVTVRAISVIGDVTDWSDPVSFIGGAAPVITSPTNNTSTGGKPLINWSKVDGATSYSVKIVNIASNVVVVQTGNLTGTSFTPSTNLASGKYRIWVRAVSLQGHLSGWSTAVDITVAGTQLQKQSATPILTTILQNGPVETVSKIGDTSDRQVITKQETISAQTSSYVEQEISADVSIDATIVAEATDHVMAAWDASEWWNANSIVSGGKNKLT